MNAMVGYSFVCVSLSNKVITLETLCGNKHLMTLVGDSIFEDVEEEREETGAWYVKW